MKKLLSTIFLLFFFFTVSTTQTLRYVNVSSGLPNRQIRQIMELPNGQILVDADGMYCLYNGNSFVPLTCNLDSVRHLPVFGCHSHLWQGDSLLWLKDYYNLYLFDTRTRSFIYSYKQHDYLPALQRFVNEDGDSATHSIITGIESHQQSYDSLVAGSIFEGEHLRAWLRDRQGGQWFGTQNNGIIYQHPSSQNIRLIKLENGDRILGMISLDNETMLLGGEKGIYEYDCKSERIVRSLATGDIACTEIHRDRRGGIWLSTMQGIYCYSNGSMELYNHSNTSGFIHDKMRFALPIDQSRLLVCNFMHNLGFLYPSENRMDMLNDRIPSLDTYRVMISSTLLNNRNKAIVCTQNGCFVLDVSTCNIEPFKATQSVERYSKKYTCMTLAKDGRLWLGTQNGLLIIDGDNVQRLTKSEGLSNNCIESITEDDEGYMWTGTANGVNRIYPNSHTGKFEILQIDSDDGLPPIEMTERGICMMPNGTLYLSTMAGLVAINTKEFKKPSIPQNVVLVGLDVAGKPMPLDTLPLQLTHKQNYIHLQVSSLNYAHPHKTTYRYRILETGDNWQRISHDSGDLASIRLNALTHGQYTIEVQSSTGDDVWGPSLRKTFVITPPIWLSWWAKMLYAIIIISIVFILLQWYLSYKKKKLERENSLRVNKLFELRDEAHRRFAQTVQLNPSNDTDSNDDEFTNRLMKAIEDNIDKIDYSVNQFALDVGMSRANLYKKMQNMLGTTPNDFMRNVRLKRAAQLLAESTMPINQIAMSVGFQTPRYFSQNFRKMFGLTPSEYRSGK